MCCEESIFAVSKYQSHPLFLVIQSPLRDKPLTTLEILKEIPHYIIAFTLYFDLWLLHYTVVTTRSILFVFTFTIGTYTNDVNRSGFSTACLIYITHCLVSIAFIKGCLSSKERLRWFYDHVGERRAKPKLFY